MQQAGAHDNVQICTDAADLGLVRRMLAVDPIWATYALADLQAQFAADCRWMTATSGGGDALALIYRGLHPPILFTMGASRVLAELLAQVDLPDAIYASVSESHLPVVAQYYNIDDVRPMQRMVLADSDAALQGSATNAGVGDPAVTRLTGAHAAAVQQLLANGGPFTPDAFSPAQMDGGVFFGLFRRGELLAVGGTHIVDFTHGLAAIGNMYTHPGHRRHGYSSAILRAIVGELLKRGAATIVLNVDQRNPGAQALYLAHGFFVHVAYVEGKGNRNVVRDFVVRNSIGETNT